MTMQNPETNSEWQRLRAAYEASRPAMEALDPKSLPQINLEIPQAVMTVTACIPKMQALAPQLADVPKADPGIFEKCRQYADALGHAHRQYVAASQPAEPLDAMIETLKGMHDLLSSDVEMLAKRNIVPADPLKSLAGTKGGKNTAWDVLALVAMLRDNWARIQGKTAVSLAELEQAEALAIRVSDAIGTRDQRAPNMPEASLARQRAYALMVKTYDEARRVVSYLRWHEGDADTIAPSLYKGRYSKAARTESVDPALDDTAGVGNQPAQPVTSVSPAAEPLAAPGLPLSTPFSQS